MEAEVFAASRWTTGNLIFPVRIEITPDRVSRIKPKLVGAIEESIPVANVASVSIETGWIFASIRIESSGGSTPIRSDGHYKRDARRIRDLVQEYQLRARRG